jgi:hypothetical protein
MQQDSRVNAEFKTHILYQTFSNGSSLFDKYNSGSDCFQEQTSYKAFLLFYRLHIFLVTEL